jgi:hypothetical protein
LVAAGALGAPAAVASTASVTLSGGGLAMSTASVRTVSQSPTEVDVSAPVTDARGTGAGWFVSVAAYASGSTTPPPLIATTATATCADGSECTLPVDTVDYPAAISATGARTTLFAAAPSSGLGAQTVNVRLLVPAGELDGLSLSFSVSTEP